MIEVVALLSRVHIFAYVSECLKIDIRTCSIKVLYSTIHRAI